MSPSNAGSRAAGGASSQAEQPERFKAFEAKMRDAGIAEPAIRAFERQYRRLEAGERGWITGDEALPVAELLDAEELPKAKGAEHSALDQVVVIKLNGGLGTSMGLDGPKSLIPVKAGHSFLDLIVRQVLHLRQLSGARLPLLLMNSFRTRQASLDALARYPELAQDLPLDFLQGKVPKILAEDLSPAEWPGNSELEWCPPGHGDLYTALSGSGLLDQLLDAGIEVAFVSNADNLGAEPDAAILGHFLEQGGPLMMEVADRTAADRKGGHLARSAETGGLLLRESAQCPPEELDAFQDIGRYRYFNTNNLWLHLPTLRRVLDESGGSLDLPLIRNQKTLDPRDPDSPRVYQLETAMGAAIANLPGATALRVPRRRFLPVKRCSDLLLIRSDAYRLRPDGRLRLSEACGGRVPEVSLDAAHYGRIDQLDARFPEGAPSLEACRSMAITGDVRFGAGVRVQGQIRIDAGEDGLRIPDDALLGEAEAAGGGS